jgi:hypothetical protein
MDNYNERSAYPHPDEFKVMRPEYVEDEEESLSEATITIAPFKVTGVSVTRPGARRAALYKAEEVYRSYHPSYRIKSPFPNEFVDQSGTRWKRLPEGKRDLGDYEFFDEDGSDYTDIETMLLWDIRVSETE